MNMDVIAQLGKTAGFAARGQRFATPGPNLDLIAIMGKCAAASRFEKTAWKKYIMPALGAIAGGVGGGVAAEPGTGERIKGVIGGAAAGGALGAGSNFAPKMMGNMASTIFRQPGRSAAVAGGLAGFGGATYGGYRGISAINDALEGTPESIQQRHVDNFKRYNQRFEDMAKPIQGKLDTANASGDQAEATRLRQQLQSGNFGGSWASLGGFNPLASRSASHYRNRALAAQGALQGQYNTLMSGVGGQPGDFRRLDAMRQRLRTGTMLPTEETALQGQIDALSRRASSEPGVEGAGSPAMLLRERMTAAGMRHIRPGAPGSGGPTGWDGPAGRVSYDYPRNTRRLDYGQFNQAPPPQSPPTENDYVHGGR